MKTSKQYIFGFLFFTISFCQAQEKKLDKTFTMIYTPGKNWNHQVTFDKQHYFVEHSQHLQKLRKNGKIALGGRYSDKGFMLLYAKDSIEAHSIIMEDPSVSNQIFDVELFEFRAFYSGCLNR